MKLSDMLSDRKLFGFLCVFFALKILMIADSFPAEIDSDSGSYTSGNGFTNWGWVSFLGESHGRGWPTIFIFSLVQDNAGRVLLQQALSLLSWLFFMLCIYSLVRKVRIKYVWLFFVGIISLSPHSQYFNDWIGRESIALSFALISTSLVILHSQNRNAIYIVAISVIAGILMITKPTLIFISICHLTIMLINVSKCNWRNRRTFVSLLLSLIFIMYSFANISNQNQGWGSADPTGRTANEIGFSYQISGFNPVSADLRSYLNEVGAPACATINPPSVKDNLGAPMEYAAELHSNCEGFSEYIKLSFYSNYLHYFISNPTKAIAVVNYQIGNVFGFRSNVSDLKSSYFADYLGSSLQFLFIILVLICLIYLFLFCIQLIAGYRRVQNIPLFASVIFFGISCFASIIFSLLMQPTHPSDIARQNWVAALIIKCLVVVLALTVWENQVKRVSLDVK